MIDTVETPQRGDVVVCRVFVEGEWFTVLKIFENRKHIVLHSYNEQHRLIVLEEGMKLEHVGVYVNHLGLGRTTMRRINREPLD